MFDAANGKHSRDVRIAPTDIRTNPNPGEIGAS